MGRKPKQSTLVQKEWPKITFFKILVSDFRQKIKLPPNFVKNYEKFIPKKATLKSHLGKWCEVLVSSVSHGCYFKQGWENFVKENELENGDFLVFNLVDEISFEVLIYGPTCCLKNIKQELDHQDFQTTSCPASRKSTGGNAKRGRKPMKSAEPTPHFVTILKEYQTYFLVMPKDFVIKTGLLCEKKTKIRDPKGREWPVGIRLESRGQVRLSSGWRALCKANGLAAGDTCTFHFVPDYGNLMDMEISKSKNALKIWS